MKKDTSSTLYKWPYNSRLAPKEGLNKAMKLKGDKLFKSKDILLIALIPYKSVQKII